MIVTLENVAKRYSQAFFNIHEKDCSEKMIASLAAFKIFLHTHNWCMTYLSLSSLACEQKQGFIAKLANHFKLPDSFVWLINVLVKQGRMDFLPLIIKHIISRYYRQHGIIRFAVSSSHVLDEHGKKNVETFLARALPDKKAELTFVVDPKLIVGIRIKGGAFLWERSVYKNLRRMKHHFSRQVQL